MRSTKKNKAVKTSAKQELPSSQPADPAEPVEVSFVNEDDNAEQQPAEASRGLSSERKKGGMTERQLKRINIIVDAVREHKVWHVFALKFEHTYKTDTTLEDVPKSLIYVHRLSHSDHKS